MSEAAYNDFVVSNGKRIEGITGESYADVNTTGLYGECVITVVAVNGGAKVDSTYNFLGLEWNQVVTGDNRAFFIFRYGVSAGNVTWDNDEFIPD